MSLATSIHAKLAAAAAVTATVGARIYHVDPRQQTTAPYIIYQQVVGTAAVSHSEVAGAKGGLFQFACFATTSSGAETLRDAVAAALDTSPLSTGDSGTWEDERGVEYDDAAELFRADIDLSF